MKKLFHKILAEEFPVTSTFYDTRGNSLHKAIDIATPVGEVVYSPFNGIVKSTYYNDRGGKQLIVTHDKAGYTSGYAHLSDILVQEGDQVRKGQPIALTGNTGNTTGPHLHFTMRNNLTDQKIDPLPFYDGSYNEKVMRQYITYGSIALGIIGTILTLSEIKSKK